MCTSDEEYESHYILRGGVKLWSPGAGGGERVNRKAEGLDETRWSLMMQ